MEYVKLAFSKFADFKSRSRRSEFWYFLLFDIVVTVALFFVESLTGLRTEDGTGFISSIFGLVMLIPSLSVFVRRMHDIGKSGLWFFLIFVPVIGFIVHIYLLVQDGQPGPNKWGLNPKDPDSGNSGDLGRHLVD